MSPVIPKSYKAAVFESKGGDAKLKDVEIQQPGKGLILVKVLACGVCHSDEFVRVGALGDVFPRVPGHEIVGEVVAVGEDVVRFKEGERVGGPWHGGTFPPQTISLCHDIVFGHTILAPFPGRLGQMLTCKRIFPLGHDGACRSCQRGFFQTCVNEQINGVTRDGGYAEYVTLRAEAAVRVPAGLDPAEAAPLLCAGVTVFNSMRQMKVLQGGVVAVQGLGGLGHLAVQFANKMGYEVVALSSGSDKKDFATQLGAHHYVNTSEEDPVQALQKLGGADMIVATAPNAKAITGLVGGVAPGGKLVVLAPVGPLEVDSTTLVIKGASVQGWPSGHALDCEECIAFAQTHKVKCMIEKFAFKDVQKALDHMTSGKARFRAVLTMDN